MIHTISTTVAAAAGVDGNAKMILAKNGKGATTHFASNQWARLARLTWSVGVSQLPLPVDHLPAWLKIRCIH